MMSITCRLALAAAALLIDQQVKKFMRNSKFKFCADGMAHPSLQLAALDLETELGCGVNDELTHDVASLRAVLNERASCSFLSG